jgi:hypothetical protein
VIHSGLCYTGRSRFTLRSLRFVDFRHCHRRVRQRRQLAERFLIRISRFDGSGSVSSRLSRHTWTSAIPDARRSQSCFIGCWPSPVIPRGTLPRRSSSDDRFWPCGGAPRGGRQQANLKPEIKARTGPHVNPPRTGRRGCPSCKAKRGNFTVCIPPSILCHRS